jgi:hypothetical protein
LHTINLDSALIDNAAELLYRQSPAKSLADVWRAVTRRQPHNIYLWFNGLVRNPDECPC